MGKDKKDKKGRNAKTAALFDEILQEIIDEEAAMFQGLGDIPDFGITAATAIGDEIGEAIGDLDGKKIGKKIRKLGMLGKKASREINDILGEV